MKLQRYLLVPMLSCLALACTPSGDDVAETMDTLLPTSDSGDGDPTTGDGDPTGDGDGDPFMAVATITGMVTDATGAALPGAGVQFCGPINEAGDVELCIPLMVADDGSFTHGASTAALWSLKVVHGPLDGRTFAGQSFQVDVMEGQDMDFSAPAIVIPEVASLTDLSGASGETAVMIDNILTVNIDPAMATGPDFQSPSELGGIMVPMEHWRHMDVDGGTVIAAWSFAPFGTKSMEGTSFSFMIDDALGLAANDAVTFYEVEKDNGSRHMIGTGVVNMDASGIDVTPVGNGFHELSWLLVVQ